MAWHEGIVTSGVGVQGHVRLLKHLFDFITGNHVEAVAVGSTGGTGYTVGDVLTVAGGTTNGDSALAAQFEVTSVAAGVVDGIRVKNWGSYSANPTTTDNAVTGGTGSGGLFDLTMLTAEWVADGSTNGRSSYVDDQTGFYWIATGANASGVDPVVIIEAFISAGNPQWQLMVATGYNNAANQYTQPGSSPNLAGAYTGTETGRVPLTTSSIHYFFQATGRHIQFVADVSPSYEHGYVGCYSPFVTTPSTDFPAPFIVAGTTTRNGEDISDPYASNHACLARHGSKTFFIRWIDGTWKDGENSFAGIRVFPHYAGTDLANPTADAPNIATGSGSETPSTGYTKGGSDDYVDGDSPTLIAPAPVGVNNQTYHLLPCTLWQDEPGLSQVIGEIEDLAGFPGRGISAEDRMEVAGEQWCAFPNTNNSGLNYWHAIREG